MKKFVPVLPKSPAPVLPVAGVPVSSGTGSGNPAPLSVLPAAPTASVVPAASIGFVPSAPNVSDATGTKQFQRLPFPIASGGSQSIPIPGSTVFVELLRTPFQGGASAEYFAEAKPDNGPAFPLYEGAKYRFDTPFNNLQIRNLNGGDAYFVLWIGFGDFAHPVVSSPRSYEFSANGAAIANAAHAAGNIVTVGTIDAPPYPYTSARLARFRMEKTTTTAAALRAFIFSGTISAALGSNIPFTLLDGDGVRLQGIVDLPAFITGGAGSTLSVCEVSGIAIPLSNYYADNNFSSFDPLSGGQFTVVIVATSAYTPGAAENCRIRSTLLPN